MINHNVIMNINLLLVECASEDLKIFLLMYI